MCQHMFVCVYVSHDCQIVAVLYDCLLVRSGLHTLELQTPNTHVLLLCECSERRVHEALARPTKLCNTLVQLNLSSCMRKEAVCWSSVKQHCARNAGNQDW